MHPDVNPNSGKENIYAELNGWFDQLKIIIEEKNLYSNQPPNSSNSGTNSGSNTDKDYYESIAKKVVQGFKKYSDYSILEAKINDEVQKFIASQLADSAARPWHGGSRTPSWQVEQELLRKIEEIFTMHFKEKINNDIFEYTLYAYYDLVKEKIDKFVENTIDRLRLSKFNNYSIEISELKEKIKSLFDRYYMMQNSGIYVNSNFSDSTGLYYYDRRDEKIYGFSLLGNNSVDFRAFEAYMFLGEKNKQIFFPLEEVLKNATPVTFFGMDHSFTAHYNFHYKIELNGNSAFICEITDLNMDGIHMATHNSGFSLMRNIKQLIINYPDVREENKYNIDENKLIEDKNKLIEDIQKFCKANIDAFKKGRNKGCH